ncbi:hypothetical protein [Streptomyces ipomoeae]|uniref:hypothetical protein n=1 Tax=Streptomyces ipomoeae TaxID=103232 RepID=UPI0011476607|nr:hypothetical protein [Streptomyces ipomoeae]MDX2934429.1 hypothetical protein [Streptomyces ipomoeae]TQE17435.1 hypothetical protein SipoB123_36725 [Streptomyces ipomoeae]
MSGRPFRRTALPCALGRSAHLVLALALTISALVLFCAGPPIGEAPVQSPHAVSAAPTASAAASASASASVVVSASVAKRPVAVRAHRAEPDPCEHDSGGHDCHSPDPRAVLGHVPLPGADHTAAPGQPAAAPALMAPVRSGEPGRARPPDLHELQLLRV